MLIEKVGQMLIDLMTVFGQRLLGLHILNKPSLPSVFDKLLQRISLDVVLTGFPENQSSNRYLKYLLYFCND